ncbi:MAG: hypothetical protein MJY91_09475 [Bacteroidales bacterium]|nr:hypothetical protein [Bacteroidales bacterium]
MKRFLPLLMVLFILSGCSKAQWIRLNQNCYIYGNFPKDCVLSWDGKVTGGLVDGKGTITIYDDEGKLLSKDKIDTKLGVVTDYSYMPTPVGDYIGKKKKDLPHGFGVLIAKDTVSIGTFKKGQLDKGHYEKYVIKNNDLVICSVGTLKHGKNYGPTKYYYDGIIVFEGSFKNGKKNGIGKGYRDGKLVYSGSWKNGEKNGYGIQYNESGIVVYQGEWKHDLYNGNGKLYKDGVCQEGIWCDGMLKKSISESFLDEISKATKHWISPNTESTDSTSVADISYDQYSQSKVEFIENLNGDLEEYLSAQLGPRVQQRFGFWNIIRMIFQPWMRSDVKRAEFAQKYFCKNISAEDLTNWINAKIDFYNQTHSDNIQYIKLNEISKNEIVTSDVALKIFEREAMETTDILVGIVIDILVCWVVAFILGLIIGVFIPALLPYAGIIDLVMTIIAFIIGIYVSVFRTTPLSIEIEDQIRQLLVDNYLIFFDSQNIITQILGL